MKLGRILKRSALFLGISLIIISMYLSYDGFDGKVGDQIDVTASVVAIVIGVIFAATVTVVQFIFTNDYRKLNPTMIVVGILSYVYSIYTNKLGAQNILGMSGFMAWATAFIADVLAEPLVSYGLGESLVGDLIGNLMKVISGDDEPEKPKYQPQHKVSYHPNNEVMKMLPHIKKGSDMFRREQ